MAHSTPPSQPRLNKAGLVPVLLAVAILAGCAAQANLREARVLISTGQDDAALDKLQLAMQADPKDLEIHNAWRATRANVLANHLDRGRRALESNDRADAERHYRRVMAIDPDSTTAREGLRRLARLEQLDKMLKTAEAKADAKEYEAARRILLQLLNETPENEAAQDLMRSVDRQLAAIEAQGRAARAMRKPLGIELREASLRQAFEIVGRAGELNILLDKDVKADQRVSLMLKDSSVEAAFQYLLMTNQLAQQKLDANTVLVFPNNAGKLHDYQQLTVKTFMLSNANAKAVAEMIKTIVKSRDVVVDEKRNMIVMRDSAEAVGLAEKLVALQDAADPEVLLDVEVIEVTRDRLLNLGVAWPQQMSLTPLSLSGGGNPLTLNDLWHQNSNSLGVTINPLTVNAQATDTDTNLLTNPRIRVINHEKAKVVIGDKVPMVTVNTVPNAGLVSDTVTYLDVGLKLEVEPDIFVDNEIALKMNLEVSNIISQQTTKDGTLVYTIGTRQAMTTLRLKDGENQILGGLISDQDQRTANKVPGLGELPIAGKLFGADQHDRTKTEIVMSITPHLIRNVHRPSDENAAFNSGTEANPRGQRSNAAESAKETSKVAGKAADPAASAEAEAVATPSTEPTLISPRPSAQAPVSLPPASPDAAPASEPVPAVPAAAPLSISQAETSEQ
ncbi:MAG: general secretion pathway protein GspD [Paucibacter sp.]|nr:general secretion pathway protein GspD [Roseateles sp.]